MSKKRWFDDWFISKSEEEIIVDLPYSHGIKKVVFVGQNTKHKGILWLIDLLDCALTELTKK